MDDQELFRKMDENERMYAPDQVPGEGALRAELDDGEFDSPADGTPVVLAVPNASAGMAHPTAMAPAIVEHSEHPHATDDEPPRQRLPLEDDRK